MNGAGCPQPLQELFRAINHKGRYQPIVSAVARPDAVCKTAELSGTLRLPLFTLEDIGGAVTSGHLFPPNIISVWLDSRVLSLDFPMSVLRSEIPIEEKDSFLRDLITCREQAYKTACIEGHVYLLNR
jgi:hypothetical protein